MSWFDRHEDFSLDEDRLHELEQEAREVLGDESYEELKTGIQTEVARNRGLGDIPPGYNPDKDPLRTRDSETARNILIGTLAATSIVGGAVAVYKKLKTEKNPETTTD